jgi:diguanylate cyclase (GGDEF)-like protein/PAS domain S-box-containing protein
LILLIYILTLMTAAAIAGWASVNLRHERALRALAESAAAKSELHLKEIEALARIGNWEFDLAADRICWSEETFRIFGLTPGAQEPDFADVLLSIHPEDAPLFDRAIQQAINNRESYRIDMRITCPDGTNKHIHAQGSPVLSDQSHVVRLIGTVLDITDRKRAEEILAHQAAYDALTGLVNRRYLLDRLESELAVAQRYERPLSLCLCDVDKFKKVNDTYGHASGDEILCAFGELLRDGSRRSDICGRLGGDEFCMLFPQTTAAEAHLCVERIRERLQVMAFGMKRGQPYAVTATFGIAQLRPGMTSAALLEAADKTLYLAKQRGRNCTLAVS